MSSLTPTKKDSITVSRIALLHPNLRAEAAAIYDEICEALAGRAICRFSHTLRTFAEQQALFNQGRTTPGAKVTNAKPGQSYHNYGLAIDIVLLIDKDKNGTFETASWDTVTDWDGDKLADWKEIVAIFKRHGWEWGGDWNFKDLPHFQKTQGYSIAQLQFLNTNKKYISGTTYVRI